MVSSNRCERKGAVVDIVGRAHFAAKAQTNKKEVWAPIIHSIFDYRPPAPSYKPVSSILLGIVWENKLYERSLRSVLWSLWSVFRSFEALCFGFRLLGRCSGFRLLDCAHPSMLCVMLRAVSLDVVFPVFPTLTLSRCNSTQIQQMVLK